MAYQTIFLPDRRQVQKLKIKGSMISPCPSKIW